MIKVGLILIGVILFTVFCAGLVDELTREKNDTRNK